MRVRKRRDKVARSIIANDRDGATSGRWDGRQLTGSNRPLTDLTAGSRVRSSWVEPDLQGSSPFGRLRDANPDIRLLVDANQPLRTAALSASDRRNVRTAHHCR